MLTATPTDAQELAEIVRQARERGLGIKAVGASHSFTGIAATEGVLVDVSGIDGVLGVEPVAGTDRTRVRLGAGTNLYQLPVLLGSLGLAMENLGDIDRQTIAGATATGTHGTGLGFRGLAAQLSGASLVTAEGKQLRVSDTENAELWPAVRLGLGALGILTELTVDCVPAFTLHAVEQPEPLEAVLADWRERAESADHFEFYWFPHTSIALTKTNTRGPADLETQPLSRVGRWLDDTVMSNGVFRLTCATGKVLPAAISAINRLATRLTGDRDFSDLSTGVFTTKRTVRFREMEYALPLDAVPSALCEIARLIEREAFRISFPVEVRAAAADELWLSTAHGRDTGYIAVHRYWREDHRGYFAAVEAVLRAHGGRPHWGKIHSLDADALRGLYPRFDDFLAIRDRLDPDRVFANDYLRRVLGS